MANVDVIYETFRLYSVYKNTTKGNVVKRSDYIYYGSTTKGDVLRGRTVY